MRDNSIWKPVRNKYPKKGKPEALVFKDGFLHIQEMLLNSTNIYRGPSVLYQYLGFTSPYLNDPIVLYNF